MNTELLRQIDIENAILDLIDHADEMTRSDLQAIVSALAKRLTSEED